jgi:hypothetical protein
MWQHSFWLEEEVLQNTCYIIQDLLRHNLKQHITDLEDPYFQKANVLITHIDIENFVNNFFFLFVKHLAYSEMADAAGNCIWLLLLSLASV